jgi:hypothetical protein
MRSVEQIRNLLYNGEEIGMGFNSDTGKAVGTALDFDPPTVVLAQEAFAQASVITSQQSLTSAMDLSAEAEGRYGLTSANLKVGFHTNTTFNSTSSFVLARSTIRNQVMRGRNFRVKPEAKALLDAMRLKEFETAFGDAFVRGLFSGGEYYALMRVTSLDTTVQRRLSVTLEAEVNGVAAGGSFKGAFNTANSKSESHSEFFVTFYQKGGAGREEIGTTLDVNEVLLRLKNFPSAVRDHPFPFQVEVATYDTVPLPLPIKQQMESFLEALADADAKKLVYMQRRNDLQFAIDHPEFFFDLPAVDALQAGVNECTRALNAVVAHAVRLSRGEIDPPQFFNPASIAPPIVLPTFRLKRRTSEHAKTFVDWYLLRNDPAILSDDARYIKHLELLSRDQVQNFDAIQDPGGDQARTDQLRAAALAPIVAQMKEFDLIHEHGGPFTSLAHLPDMLPASLEKLKIRDKELPDIRGINRFANLRVLNLSRNQISDISQLGELEKLRELDLSNNRISDIAPLAACGELEELRISGNLVRVVAPLAALPKLRLISFVGSEFKVGSNNVTTVKFLGNPILTIDELGDIEALVNPFLLADRLRVRLRMLEEEGEEFTGFAVRIGRSHIFDASLSRGAESIVERWTMATISAPVLSDNISVAIIRARNLEILHEQDVNMHFVPISKADRSRSVDNPALQTSMHSNIFMSVEVSS